MCVQGEMEGTACATACITPAARHALCHRVLGTVDQIGTAYSDDFIATGFGGHLALPIIRERWSADMTEGDARALLEDCMRICFYRDCRAINKLTLGKAETGTAVVSDPYSLETKWDYASFKEPKSGTDTGGSW